MKYTGLDLAYAAGVFDARGCITLVKQKNNEFRHLKVKLTVTERRWAVLEYLHAKFGGGIYNASGSNSRKSSVDRKE